MQQTQNNQGVIALRSEPSWQEILSKSPISVAELLKRLQLNSHPLVDGEDHGFPVRVPEPYLSKISIGNPDDPLLLQVLPQSREAFDVTGYVSEPLEEQGFSPAPGLIHKYQSRVLLITTQACAIHCRYCFRRNFPYSDHQQNVAQWHEALKYVKARPDINEVILSGGDPLSLPDALLKKLLNEIDAIPSVHRIRLHTRYLPALPQRITPELSELLGKQSKKILIVSHCNHKQELGNDTRDAFERLAHSGVTLLNQTVLLKSVNDQVEHLVDLSEELFEQGVMPYYLFVLDKVKGAAHFDIPEAKAIELHTNMRARLPGFLVPELMREVPGEKSKIPVS